MSFEDYLDKNGWGSFLSIPVYSQLEIVNSGKKIAEETLDVLKGKTDSDIKESARLAQLARKSKNAWGIYENENLNTTMTDALYGFRQYLSDTSRLHMSMANDMKEHTLATMDQTISRETDAIHRQKQSYEQSMKSVASCENNLNRAKRHLERMSNEVEDCKRRLESALSRPPPLEPVNAGPFNIAERLGLMNEDPQRWRLRLYKAEESVRSAQQELVKAKNQLYTAYQRADEATMSCARIFQNSERARIEEVKAALEKVVLLEGEYLGSRKASLAQLQAHVVAIDADLDHRKLVEVSRNPDQTHRYSKALELLDWDFDRHTAKRQLLESEAETGIDESKEQGYSLKEASIAREQLEKQMADMKVWMDKLLPDPSDADKPIQEIETKKSMARLGYLVSEKEEREGFLQLLNKKRSVRTEVPEPTFVPMAEVGHAFLDACQKQEDVSSAKQLMIMANTFYRLRNSEELEPSEDYLHEDTDTDGGQEPEENKPAAEIEDGNDTMTKPVTGSGSPLHEIPQQKVPHSFERRCTEDLHKNRVRCREYLQSHLKGHGIWTNEKFWEDALFLAVQEQFDGFTEPLLWDELSNDALKDAVLRVHNIVYSQLAATALNMVEFGVPKDIIEKFVDEKCLSSQLCEDQVLQLKQHIAKIVADRDRQDQREKTTLHKNSLS